MLKPIVIGIDWARYGDFTAAVVISGNRSNIHVHHIDRLFGSEWANQIAWIKEILHDFPTARLVCDRTGIGDGPTEQLRLAITQSVRPVHITSQSKPELIDSLVRAFETNIIRLPPHPALITELQNFKAIPTSTGHIRLQATSGNDDLIIALALAVHDLPAGTDRNVHLGRTRVLTPYPITSRISTIQRR